MLKNSNSETNELLKKAIVIGYIIIALVVINIFVTIIVNGKVEEKGIYDTDFDVSMFKTITVDELEDELDSGELTMVVFGKPNCEYTNQMLPILEQAQKDYNYVARYIDIRYVSESQRDIVLSYDDDTEFLSEYLGTTPLIIVFKDGKMLDTWVGYEDYETFSKFLRDLGF